MAFKDESVRKSLLVKIIVGAIVNEQTFFLIGHARKNLGFLMEYWIRDC